MKKKKIVILLTDGVSLKNFIYSDFISTASNLFEIYILNLTPFDLSDVPNCEELKVAPTKVSAIADLLKTAKITIQLNRNSKRNQDPIYQRYKFPLKYTSFTSFFKFVFLKIILLVFNSEFGLKLVSKGILFFESKTDYYLACKRLLNAVQPNFVFSTTQRAIQAQAPLIAAKKLKIPTACFVFSWDNLPKATLVLETDYYFVWSQLMKKELLHYYPNIKPEQVYISGTPQFEKHKDASLLLDKELFYKKYNLDTTKKYICFSGDDVTTSPNDQFYLKDLAASIKKLNENGENIGIIFRRCPVDFSNRYQPIIDEFPELITPIAPIWDKIQNSWNTIYPKKEDLNLLLSIIHYSEFVVNVGSSMVFDFISDGKPCFYLNYEVADKIDSNHQVMGLYDFVHFRSMPSKNAVFWLNSKTAIEQLYFEKKQLQETQKWFEIINEHPIELASTRMVSYIDAIINKNNFDFSSKKC